MDANNRRSAATDVQLNLQRLNELLANKGITKPGAAAEFLGIHRSVFSLWMKRRVLPSLPIAVRAARRLETSVEDLVEDKAV